MAVRSLQGYQYDFSSPYVTCAIVSPRDIDKPRESQLRVPLWTDLHLSDSERQKIGLGLSSLPYVSSVAVEIGLGFVPKLSVVLTPPFQDAQKFLDSDLMEWGFTRLEVQFGYTGGAPGGVVLSPVFSGMILKPEMQFGTESTISLTAIGDGGWAALLTENTSNLAKASRKDLITQLAKGPDGTRRFEVDFNEAERDSEVFFLLNNDPVSLCCAGQTEWFLIQHLVRECRCYSFVHGGTLYLLPRSLKSSEPGRFFHFFKNQGGYSPETGVFPILTYNSPTMAVYLSSAAKSYVLRDIDALTKEDLQVEVGLSDAQIARLEKLDPSLHYTDSRGTVTPPNGPDLPGSQSAPGAAFPTGSPNDSSTVSQATTELDNNSTMLGIQANVTSLGIPDLQPGEVVSTSGLATKLCTNYAILTVKHTLDSQGYQTEWGGISNVGQITTFLPAEYKGLAAPEDRAAVLKYRQERDRASLDAFGDSLSQEVFPSNLSAGELSDLNNFLDSQFGPNAKVPATKSTLDKSTLNALQGISKSR